MTTPPTAEELRTAWEAMRTRRALAHWPAEFEDVMRDAMRSRLVAIEATAARRQCQQQRPVFIGFDPASGPDRTAYWRPPAHPTQQPDLFDRKRAAAGDLD
ncbi:hypothetical protein [Hydrogenophaga electricum]|uniref:Uncharacterized protein n=1 Tax=Hydrogenophaga electricum TaxID=1230953 RepID=A0ABQ6BZU3_9BURK|nr:hypothetical protein [Hydrogenophaga electricum]GLS13631.1 hypothetical protein GCM10007935_10610 [Hydrogenophaga electricum]